MQSDYDRRHFNGVRQLDKTARYYEESGILAVLYDLETRGFTQEEMIEQLLQAGYRNSNGQASFTQPCVSKILRRAREKMQLPAPLI